MKSKNGCKKDLGVEDEGERVCSFRVLGMLARKKVEGGVNLSEFVVAGRGPALGFFLAHTSLKLQR